jgi:SAM-dependent methyltransferase
MTVIASATFEPARYKESTREQWQAAAEAWNRWGPQLERWLGPATEVMLDLAAVGRDNLVLDIAAGSGGQTLAAARRVGPGGRVLATDVAPAILDFADANARTAGFTNVATRVMDGEQLDVESGQFDAAISRVGLIYFPDQQRALAGILRALRPGGRFAAIVYSTPDRNPFFSIPVSIIRERAHLAPPAPGQPGPFSLAVPGVAETALVAAGFTGVVAVRIDAPLRMSSAAECVRFEQESFGALHQMLAGLAGAEQSAVWEEIREQLTEFESGDGFSGPCELVVVAGTAPETDAI